MEKNGIDEEEISLPGVNYDHKKLFFIAGAQVISYMNTRNADMYSII